MINDIDHVSHAYYFWLLLHCAAFGILVPKPDVELLPPALELGSLNHWTHSIVHQALYLSDLGPYIYFSLPLYNHKGFDLGHT